MRGLRDIYKKTQQKAILLQRIVSLNGLTTIEENLNACM